MELEEGDIVLCTVDRIVGAVVFVKIDGNGEGSIVLSEVAPGRIRNIRDYVVPKKKIVCKVLKIDGNNIQLSLRRVTKKEKEEVLKEYNLEKKAKSILNSVLKEKSKEIIEEIKKQGYNLGEFLFSPENHKKILQIIPKPEAERILEIVKKQRAKKTIIKKVISLKTILPEGLNKIKEILEEIKDCEIKYIAGGEYQLKIEDENIKEADQKLRSIVEEIRKKAKKEGIDFEEK